MNPCCCDKASILHSSHSPPKRLVADQDDYDWVGESCRSTGSCTGDNRGCWVIGDRLGRLLIRALVTTTALVGNKRVVVHDDTTGDNSSSAAAAGGSGGSDHYHPPPPLSAAASTERDNFRPFGDANDQLSTTTTTTNNNNTNEVCFLPDLHALRFWSHPRSDPSTLDNNNNDYYYHHHSNHPIIMASEQPNEQASSPPPTILQGVLWKRRDIFTNRWRPRWFVLHPPQGLLTYYLLDETVSGRLAAANASLPQATTVSTVSSLLQPTTFDPSSSSFVPRRRTSSWDSLGGLVSENAVDYDVVPRGTIYLIGCTVTVNETLSKPNQQLFALTIRPPPPNSSSSSSPLGGDTTTTAPHVHLAARSATARDAWVQRLQYVCRQRPVETGMMMTLSENVPDDSSPPTIITTTNEGVVTATTTTRAGDESAGANVVAAAAAVVSRPPSPPPPPPPAWTSVGSASRWYENVPPAVAQRIQTVMDETLPILSSSTDDDTEGGSPDPCQWKEVFRQGRDDDDNNNVMARSYWRKPNTTNNTGDTTPPPMLYSTAVLEQQVPCQVFDVLVDPDQQAEWDPSIKEAARLHVLNPHTFYEYCSYRAAWPTSPRELVTVLHWRVVVRKKKKPKTKTNNDEEQKEEEEERAILIVSFSCPEAEQVRGPPAEGHVRAKLHVCLTLLQPKPMSSSSSSSSSASVACLVQRVLSVDMGGFQVGFPWTNIMLTQRFSLLVRLADYLRQYERQDALPTMVRSALIDDEMCQKIILRQGTYDNQMDAHRRSPGRHRKRTESREDAENEDAESLVIDDTEYRNGKKRSSPFPKEPSVVTQAILLFVPVAMAKFAVLLQLPYPSLWFFLCVFVMIRRIVLLHLGEYIPLNGPNRNTERSRQQLTGPVTCRFQVDLKGVLRFIANKKEEREELKTGTAEVSVVHIVACAVARALRDEPQLDKRRFSIPWLFIDVLCPNRHPDDGVSVTISENEDEPITLKSVDKSGVQTVADQFAQLTKLKGRQQELGQCLVMATTNYDQIDMETDSVPIDPSVRVVAVIGGVRLEHNPHPARRASHGLPPNHNRSLRPVLALSLTMGGPAGCPGMGSVDFVTCRRFAEEVQKLLQFPEMCDNQ